MSPPILRFLTKVYHPNIDEIGRIHIKLLSCNWSPAINIRCVLQNISNYLYDPDLATAENSHIGKHWIIDQKEAEKTAEEWCYLYATS